MSQVGGCFVWHQLTELDTKGLTEINCAVLEINQGRRSWSGQSSHGLTSFPVVLLTFQAINRYLSYRTLKLSNKVIMELLAMSCGIHGVCVLIEHVKYWGMHVVL